MSFKNLINRNKQNVRNIIRLITKEPNEDLEQDVLVNVWKNRHKYTEKGNFRAWICTIAKNLSKDYLKSASKKNERYLTSDETVINSVKDNGLQPDAVFQNKLRQKTIFRAVESLKPKLKEVIILCEINDYTYENAARKLNVPIGTIKSRIYNAKKELALKLSNLINEDL